MVWFGGGCRRGEEEVLVGGRRCALSVMVGAHMWVGGLTRTLGGLWVKILSSGRVGGVGDVAFSVRFRHLFELSEIKGCRLHRCFI